MASSLLRLASLPRHLRLAAPRPGSSIAWTARHASSAAAATKASSTKTSKPRKVAAQPKAPSSKVAAKKRPRSSKATSDAAATSEAKPKRRSPRRPANVEDDSAVLLVPAEASTVGEAVASAGHDDALSRDPDEAAYLLSDDPVLYGASTHATPLHVRPPLSPAAAESAGEFGSFRHGFVKASGQAKLNYLNVALATGQTARALSLFQALESSLDYDRPVPWSRSYGSTEARASRAPGVELPTLREVLSASIHGTFVRRFMADAVKAEQDGQMTVKQRSEMDAYEWLQNMRYNGRDWGEADHHVVAAAIKGALQYARVDLGRFTCIHATHLQTPRTLLQCARHDALGFTLRCPHCYPVDRPNTGQRALFDRLYHLDSFVHRSSSCGTRSRSY